MDTQAPIRKQRAAAVTLGGVLVIGLGVIWSILNWSYPVLSSVLIEVGAGIALIALIVYFEREIVSEETAALGREFEQRHDDLSGRVDSLASDLSNLNERIEQTRRARYEAQDETVQNLESNPTASTTAKALLTARAMNAVADPLYVQATTGWRGIHIGISPVSDLRSSTSFTPRFREDTLRFQFYTPGYGKIPRADSTGPMPVAGSLLMDWTNYDSPAEFVDNIVQEFQRLGIYEPSMIDGEAFFTNLRKTLDIAIRLRRGEDPDLHRPNGRLVEVYDDGLYITTEGIECPSRKFVQPADQYLRENPDPPKFIAAEEWTSLVKLTTDLLEIRPKGDKPAGPAQGPQVTRTS